MSLIIPSLLLLLSGHVQSHLFTAVADLEGVLKAEAVLITTLEQRIHEEEHKLMLLKAYHEYYKIQHAMAKEDVQKYLSNPLSAYLLIKRLTVEWRQVEDLLRRNIVEELIRDLPEYSNVLKFPTEEDLNGAAVALTRLQGIYRLDTSSLAKGEIKGIKYTPELNAADCFELGRQSYINADFHHTHAWMTEANDRLTREGSRTIERSDILEYLAGSAFELGDTASALNLTNRILELKPNNEMALYNKAYLESNTLESPKNETKGDNGKEKVPENQQLIKLYEQLCRGDLSTPKAVLAELRCRYVDNNNPFLKIAPFKMEEVYTTPKIVIFHDVMSDEEIATLKELALPRFQRAEVRNPDTGNIEYASYRISKVAWFAEGHHPHVAAVVQRVEDMTGLNMKTSELLQVANYGLGGHYEPHYDMTLESKKTNFTRNRIATVLFYMTDVSEGGATVFPYIKAALAPKKGTAVFWYNLHSSGEGDIRTAHAACPVLVGSKWVSNQWIDERGQEFRRPCELTRPPPDLTI